MKTENGPQPAGAAAEDRAPAFDAAALDHARLFLEGRSDDALKRLGERMQAAADEQRYEQAAIYRGQIQSLSSMAQRQYADTGLDLDADASITWSIRFPRRSSPKRGSRRKIAQDRAMRRSVLFTATVPIRRRLTYCVGLTPSL